MKAKKHSDPSIVSVSYAKGEVKCSAGHHGKPVLAPTGRDCEDAKIKFQMESMWREEKSEGRN
jgi:hypothetical protein